MNTEEQHGASAVRDAVPADNPPCTRNTAEPGFQQPDRNAFDTHYVAGGPGYRARCDLILRRTYSVIAETGQSGHHDPELRQEIVDHNFTIGAREFSIQRLQNHLEHLLNEYGDEIRASRKRLAKARTRYSV